MTLAVVAPAGFVGVEVAVGLLGLLMVLVCIALRGIWIHTFGRVFLALADLSIPLPRLPDPHPFGRLKAWNANVLNWLHDQQETGQHIAGYFFHAAAILLGWMARELRDLAAATLHALDKLEHAHLPTWTKAMLYALFPPALIARLVRAAIHAELPHVIRTTVTHTVHTVTHTVTRIIHGTTGAVAIPGWVIRLPRRVGRLERDRAGIWKRLRKLELVLGAAGAAALVARALGLRAASCLRSGNIGRAARTWCGLNPAYVDDLLFDLLPLLSLVSVVEMAKATQAITDTAVDAVRANIRETS